MAPSESTALTELTNEVKEFRADFRVFRTKLMGDDESEIPEGRIPRIEATLANHEKRIARGERITLLGRGMVLLVLAIAAIMQVWYHVLGVMKH